MVLGARALLNACQRTQAVLQWAAYVCILPDVCSASKRKIRNLQERLRGAIAMANKKGNRIVIKLKSTESGHTYTTEKNRRNDPSRLELRRYDPILRRHVTYRETK
jgi:large subunit ribosomal protein L33